MRNALSSIKTDKQIDWEQISQQMVGFSAALIVKIAVDAAKNAVINGDGVVSIENLNIALSENQLYFKS